MYKNVLLPVDLGDAQSAKLGVKRAVECASAAGCRLSVMTVVPDFGLSIVGSFFPEGFEQKALEETDKMLHEFVAENVPEGIDVHTIVAHGTIYEKILEVANETGCDLIVMASHRPELSDYLLGPNAARVARHANCSVLVVRG